MAIRASDFFDQLNPWWSSENFRYQLHERIDYIDPIIHRPDRLMHILIGGRRVGKTSILHTVVNKLLSSGEKRRHIIFLTGELREVQEQGICRTVHNLLSRLDVKRSTSLHIFIDEVQEIPKWQTDVKLLYDATRSQLYLSGSSSLLLTEQTAKLTGRYRLRHVLPLSFKEFLLFKGIKAQVVRHAPEKILLEYLRIGGYPEYVLNNDPAYLRQCIESTLYRELLSAYGLRNPALLQDLLYFLADKMTNEVSVKRTQKDLKIDDKTARFYLRYLQDIYLIYPTFRAGKSHRITKGSNPKYYFNDPGVLALMGKTFRLGHAAENAVFLELLRKQSDRELPRIEYTIIDGQEIDFVCEGRLYEVKATVDLNTELLEAYSDIGSPVTMVVLGNVKRLRNYSSSLKPVSLHEFLLR